VIRFYRALLHLYPRGFRHEYGAELCALFQQQLRDRPGLSGRLALIFETIPDVIVNASAAHFDVLRQDLRYTTRALLRAPGFALTTILLVALGVGANTAAFSLADFVLLRPPPFAEPDRLVRVWQTTPGYGQMEVSPANYHDYKAKATASFASMGAYGPGAANLVGSGEPRRLQIVPVTPELMPLLGVPALMGRVISPADSTRGVAVISYGLWQSQFAGDPGVLGRVVRLDNEPHTIVGVMPASFSFPGRHVELWRPLLLDAEDLVDRGNNNLWVIGRLAQGVTLERASSEMSAVAARLEQEYPKENRETGAAVYAFGDEISERARLLVLTLCGAALCILLLACANLANLLLARGLSRSREFAVRTALGAGRDRLMRQLITECVILALIGGMVGIAVATTGAPLLARLVPDTLPTNEMPALNLRVLAFAGALIALTGFGFGVAPALFAGRSSALDTLRDGARAGGGRTQRTRGFLVTIEVAGSIVLLITAGLLVRAVWRIQAIDPGFRVDGVFTLQTPLSMPAYATVAAREQFYSEVLQDVRALPGVQEAAFISGMPMVFRGGIWPVSLTGEEAVREASNTASMRYVTPRYFATLGIPLRKGRDVAETDDTSQPYVAVVSESFVQRHWPDEDPIGKRFRFAFDERAVVGVVADVKVRGLERVSEPQVYLPSRQVKDSMIVGYAPKELVVRSTAPMLQLMPAIRRSIYSADPDQPIANVRSLEEIVGEETAPRRVQLQLLGLLAAIALLIAGVGIHGLLSFTVSQRTQEICIRRALGAQTGSMVGMILREGLALVLLGTVIGVALAYIGGRTLGSLLAGIRPEDPVTIITAVALGLLTAAIGCLRPALRAARIDPITALRQT
jgi:predicted permease